MQTCEDKSEQEYGLPVDVDNMAVVHPSRQHGVDGQLAADGDRQHVHVKHTTPGVRRRLCFTSNNAQYKHTVQNIVGKRIP